MTDMRISSSDRSAAIILVALGVLLHVVNAVLDWRGQAWSLTLALLTWSALPYLAGLLLLFAMRRPLIVLPGLMGPFIVDLLVEYHVYVKTPTSTAALDLVLVPLLNLMVIGPLGLLIGWIWVGRRFSH